MISHMEAIPACRYHLAQLTAAEVNNDPVGRDGRLGVFVLHVEKAGVEDRRNLRGTDCFSDGWFWIGNAERDTDTRAMN